MDKILVIYGTRPELIKVAPIICEFEKNGFRQSLIIVNTGQHKEILEEAYFKISPDYHLNSLEPGQSLSSLTAILLERLENLIISLKKDHHLQGIIAQGDTATTFTAALSAFYHKIRFFHIEAGLRTYDINHPYPEEFYRKTISSITALHFAPSQLSADQLRSEGIHKDKIILCGNTVIDTLQTTIQRLQFKTHHKKNVLITMHRRCGQNENFTWAMEQVKKLSNLFPDDVFTWIRHPSKFVMDSLNQLQDQDDHRVRVVPPMSYSQIVEYFLQCKMIITDSGGIQEEAAFLGIPVMILREKTERTELLDLENILLVKPGKEELQPVFETLLKKTYPSSKIYGEGYAAGIIFKAIQKELAVPGLDPVFSRV